MHLPERFNVALELIDSHIRLGRGTKAAILCGEQTVSYADLHDSVNRVGNALIDMGVRREERVAILLPDRPEWAFVFFGAIKIGAVAVPLNTMLAPEDCQYVINDSGARVLVVDRAQLDRIAKVRASLSHVKNVIVIDDDVDGCFSMEEIQRTCSPSLQAADTSQSDMAFWLYSSGTTAVPKGVIHRHRDMIVAADQYAQQTIGLRETDVSFSVAKLFFAYGLGNGLYFPLRCGGTTVLLPEAALPETVFDIFDRYQPTFFYSVPTSYAGLLHTAEKTGRTSIGRVRMCVSAGETLPKIIYEKWHERFGVEILDGIGSTEMLHIYISNRPGQVKAGSTGTLVPGYQAKILDEDGQEVPAGVVGKLLVKGESAAAGYWNRDDDTRETFRGGWLDSRDSFKVDEDGFYWYAGRSDDMIKVAGQAVWPARVESILQRHPAVVECAVAGAPGPDGLIKLRAAVVLNHGHKASPELVRQLQHFVRKNASPHECPHQVTFVQELPKTATGKIQRFKLRTSASVSDQPTPPPQFQADGLRSREETSNVFERISHAPLGPRMELLASHLQRELERILYLPEPPALDAGFSELGMDSLRAVEFRDLLQSQFGHQLTLSSTLAFDYPSVNQLARHLVDQLRPLSNNAAKQSHRRFDPSEPLAVIGLACRFPGAPDSEAFWQLLERGVDAVSEVPAERWDIDARYDPDPDKPGKMSTRYGGFLRKVDYFDAELFGIASREAARMDPQHRLLLEVGWEALENAGIAGRKLRGSNTGVFVGVSSSDYAQLTGGDLNRVDFYVGTGSGPAYAAGRLSHFFGLQGPSQVVDTTCSSSLVSVHQACQSLRSQECDLALAGGVNLMLTPDTYVFLSRAKALAPDGRCKTFDAAADGFSRSEGCGLVVLKRWSDARRDGDRVLALIRGSAVNHDGPSGGLTVPHGPSQQQVIRNALRQAGCKPSDVSYLEAHGTGTKLGDPIEIQAAAAVFGYGRSSDQPLLIGSVKTNIGHSEAAAGIAGLIKVVLAIQHGVIPKQLHFDQPNPHIPWDRLPIRVCSQAESWPSSRRLAGVSAFGFSGTNAHVLLEGPPARDGLPAPKRPERSHHLLVLSADREDALRELAGRYSNWLEKHPQASLENVCFTASTGRSHLEHRAALVSQSSDQLTRQLAHLQMGRKTEGVLSARAAGKLRTAWVFAGLGIQNAGMGHELYQTEPGFREVFDTCAEMLGGWLERPLQEAVFEDRGLLEQTIYAEPALFALEMAFARVWQDWGVEPDVVVGHGVGQYAAACVAGALSLQNGLQLVAKRAGLKNCLSPGSAMAEPDLDEFEAFATLLTFQPAERTLICTLTGRPVEDGEVLDAVYWRRHASEPEQFEAGLAALANSGVTALLEIGPDAMLQEVAGRIWPTEAPPTVVSSLRSGMGDVQQTVEALAALYVHGVTPDFEAFDRPWPREKISLPTYPFQRQRYWVDTRGRPEVAENPAPAAARVEELLYELRWQARGDANRSFLGTPAEIKRRTEGAVDLPGSATRHLVDAAWRADLDDLSCRYIMEAFQRLGGPWAPGKRVALDTLAGAWGVDVGYRQRLLDRLLSVLVNAGWIGQDETKWHLPPQWPPTEANQRQRALLQRHPQAEIELKLLGRCGERIDDALTGKVNPLELLFPKQGVGAHDLYRESSDAAACNLRIRQLFEQATTSLPSGRRLRVLEIGAGTGGTTASVLPVLPAARCDYVFTDVTPAFFANAARQFAQYPFVSYRTLDAEKNLEAEGFGPGQFDIVLASNVLHVTRDIEESVRHIRQVLAPGGWLVLLELVKSRAWLDATFGLLEGWWRFDDRLRSNNALMDIEGWDRVLGDEGFIVESLTTHGSADQALFLAQAPLQLPASEAGADHDRASWLILADKDGVGNSLAEMFCQRGLTCRILKQDDLDDLPNGFDDVQVQFGVGSGFPSNIVHLWNLDIDSAPGAKSIEQAERSALITASLMQAIQRWSGQVRLWFVTRGSQSVLENESTAPQQALLWGMASVACLEMPEFCHGQIDLPLEVETADLEVLRDALLDAGGEDKLAIRGDGLHVARVVPMFPSRPTKKLALDDDESFLISGGLGQLGLQTAQWLAERGAKHLILNTRRPLPDTDAGWNSADPVLRQRIREVESLRKAGVAVHILAADVSDAEALREALQRLEVPPLRGVIHAAGVPDFRQIGQWSPESLRTALAAKVNGAWNLHELTLDSDLRFFVNFSSASSIWGAHSQSAYAAANAFLDALARYRRAEGLPALSVNWARWSIGATTEEHHRSMQAVGLRAFRPAEGLAALGQLLTRGSAQAIVADVDWDCFKPVFESRNKRHLFAEIATAVPRDESDDTGVVHSGLVDRLRGAEPFEQMTLLVAHLQQLVSEVLDNRTAPSLDKGFFDLGVDSLMAVEIRNRIDSSLGADPPLPSSLVFDHPTIRELARHLLKRFNRSAELPDKPVSPVAAGNFHPDLQEPVAIIGMSCQFPGAANVEEYWELLREGRDAVGAVPSNRWEARHERSDALDINCGGFLDNIDLFDPAFFGIPPRVAANIDPQHRLLLEMSWNAFENAAIPVEQLAGSAVGVFVGISQMEYGQLLYQRELDLGIEAVTGIPLSAAAGRLSYTFGFRGPALALDTSCSSSLTAVHQACNSLRLRECDTALAAGVNVIATPRATRQLAKTGMLSPDGRCKTFDDSADGFGRGEGCGVVLLKRLSDAQADGNSILAVIRGSACNHDGATSGFTVPSGPSQERVIAAAIRQAGVRPETIDYLEAHGTGTRLGDPIEIQAAAEVLGVGRPLQQPLLIGSVKTNLGHLEAAAGIAGLIKVVLAMQNRLIPKQLHFNNPSSHIPWDRLPVKVVDEPTPWPQRTHAPLAGVSAMGASGTNVHVVLEGPPPLPQPKAPDVRDRSHHILTLSAKTPQALRELAERYLEWQNNHADAHVADVCHAAATGRSHFQHRAALVVASVEETRSQLKNLLANRPAPGMFMGNATKTPKVAWIFSDQGSLSMTLGRELYDRQPTFREELDKAAKILSPVWEVSLQQVLFEAGSLRDDTTYAQAALFAWEVSLARLYQSWGLQADMLLGYDVGQYSAACVAGMLTLEGGLLLLAERGRSMGALPDGGAMLTVHADAEQVEAAVAAYPSLSIAAFHGTHTIVSGPSDTVESLARRLGEQGIHFQPLNSSHAFHSAMIEPALGPFEALASRVDFGPADRTLINNLDGQPISRGQTLSGVDWGRHARQPVQFARSVQTLQRLGCELLLEVGPQATLLETAASCWPDDQTPTRISASLGGPNADYEMCLTLAQMYVSGANIQWAEWDAPWPRQRLSLPTYPFQRKRYWLPPQLETKSSSPGTENIASEYYDALTTSVLAPDSLFGPGKTDDAFLTFVPFPEIVPGFSWIRTFAFPEDDNNSEHRALVFREQQHMRRSLFRHVDFSSCRRALDFGCGYGSDLIRLGNQHPHLKIDGFTISARQREIIEQKIAGENLHARVRVFHRDSASDNFPERYDLIFGIEVACHIKNKDALFGNIASHLSETGTLLLADFISETQFAVEDPSTSSYLIAREEWAQLLSRRGLEIVECIDAGEEIANSLYEPDRVDTLRELNRRVSDANVKRGIESYVKLGEMLRKGLMRYVLLTVRQATSTGSELLGANQAALGGAVSYRDVAPHRWLYELEWQASGPFADVVADAPNAEAEIQCASGIWLVLADQGGVGRALATALEQRGGKCFLIEAGSAWQQLDENRWKLPPDDHAALARSVREAVDKTGTPIVGVVHLWSLDDRPPGELTPEHLATAGGSSAKSVLPLLQTLVQYPEIGKPKFWFVTVGTVATEGAELPASLASSCVWGLGRVFSLEYSQLWGGLIDLPAAEAADRQAELLLNELLGGSDEDQVAYANGKRYVPRLVHTTASPPSSFKVEADATYLITGGLGALGGQVAQWLMGRGARNLVLCGRYPGNDAQVRWAADHPDAAGCNVRIVSADVARQEDVQQLLQTIESDHPPLRGVVHAAGVIGNERLAQMTAARWDEVLRPKLQGAWILHRLTEHLPLDFFVCFSSIAAIWGSAGQAHYAAGNAFLDALCRYRHLLGLPALSINWGPIAGGGMLDVQSQEWLQERGVHAMTPQEALEVLEQLLGGDASQMVAVKVDWPRFKATYESARRRLLLDCLAREDRTATSQDRPYASTFVQRLRDVPVRQRPGVLQAYVRQQIASTLGLSHEQITPRQGLFDVGMDSLNAVELRHRFKIGLGVELPPTLLFDYPTVELLVAYLTATLPMAESTTARTEASDLSQLPNDADLTRSLEEIGDMDENNVRKSLIAGLA